MKSIKSAIEKISNNGALILLLVFLITIIIVVYIPRERFFYYWDYGGFQAVAFYNVANFIKSPLEAMKAIYATIAQDYNHFFTIPIFPLLLLFGESRLGYVLSVGFVYHLPFALICGAIAAQIISSRKRIAFWSTAFLCVCIPVVWTSTLRAYPDVGGAFLIGVAIWLYLRDTTLRSIKQILAIGATLALAILFRRHFAYNAIAFFLAIFIHAPIVSYIKARERLSQPRREFFLTVLRLGLIGISSLLTLLLLGKSFVDNVLAVNYMNLYASYMLDFREVAIFFLRESGWVIWILACLGFVLGFLINRIDRQKMCFALLLGLISILQWIFIVRQRSPQYNLQFTFFLVIGLMLLMNSIPDLLKDPFQTPIIIGLALFLSVNLIIALSGINVKYGLQSIFSSRYPPLTRSDYGQVIRLIAYLNNEIEADESVYVVDSSFIMNYDLLLKAEQQLFSRNPKYQILVTPHADSRDFYPLELLLKADYVIVTTPVQHHMPIDSQKVVQAVYRAFTEDWPISRDFVRLPEQFEMMTDAVLSIFHREAPTSLEVALSTFDDMREFIGLRPAGQSDWIIVSQPSDHIFITEQGQGQFHVEAKLDTNPEAMFLLVDKPSPNSIISGNITFSETVCLPASIGFWLYEPNGEKIIAAEEITFSRLSNDFILNIPDEDAAHLVLHITNSSNLSVPSNCLAVADFQLTTK